MIAAGQAERASRHATSGTTTPSSAGRRSSAASETAGPTSRCRTAEISRSMYMAASTIATAPTTAQPQPCWKTPARMRNSPAKAVENGTASAIIPVVISTVASNGPPARHAAEPSELTRQRPPLDHPGEQEERRRDQAVVDHLEHGAVEAEVVDGEDAHRDQAHLRERRVRDHAADVGRAEREQRPVHEPDRREREDRRTQVAERARGTSRSRSAGSRTPRPSTRRPDRTAATSGDDSL